MNTLRHLWHRVGIGHTSARNRLIPDSLGEEFEVLISGAAVDDFRPYRGNGRRVSS